MDGQTGWCDGLHDKSDVGTDTGVVGTFSDDEAHTGTDNEAHTGTDAGVVPSGYVCEVEASMELFDLPGRAIQQHCEPEWVQSVPAWQIRLGQWPWVWRLPHWEASEPPL